MFRPSAGHYQVLPIHRRAGFNAVLQCRRFPTWAHTYISCIEVHTITHSHAMQHCPTLLRSAVSEINAEPHSTYLSVCEYAQKIRTLSFHLQQFSYSSRSFTK